MLSKPQVHEEPEPARREILWNPSVYRGLRTSAVRPLQASHTEFWPFQFPKARSSKKNEFRPKRPKKGEANKCLFLQYGVLICEKKWKCKNHQIRTDSESSTFLRPPFASVSGSMVKIQPWKFHCTRKSGAIVPNVYCYRRSRPLSGDEEDPKEAEPDANVLEDETSIWNTFPEKVPFSRIWTIWPH